MADADTGGLKSFHTLFDKVLDHMLMMLLKYEQNRMVRTIQNFELFDPPPKNKNRLKKIIMVNHF